VAKRTSKFLLLVSVGVTEQSLLLEGVRTHVANK